MRYLTLGIKVVCVVCASALSINSIAAASCKAIPLYVVNSSMNNITIRDGNGAQKIEKLLSNHKKIKNIMLK